MLAITLLLSVSVLGQNINLFFAKATHYNVDPLVAAAVIKCESGGYQSAVHHNVNGTTDTGIGQINSSHWAEARAMGDEPTTLEGNLDYTLYLMSKNGFRDYLASMNCWSKEIQKAGQNTS